MRRALVVFASFMFFALSAPVAPALPAESLDKGLMFGGQWSDANNTTTDLSNLTDLPAVVEVYTATWCENCVDVEHALDEVQDAGLIEQYHIHRAIGETQDPFGSEAIDSRWNAKYGQNAPPAVVFNGTMKKSGSVTS
jgi:thiol-disulfide isomerase/thioredoxin